MFVLRSQAEANLPNLDKYFMYLIINMYIELSE